MFPEPRSGTTPGEQITDGPPSTLSQAIARAGGTKLSSDDAHVFIIRRTAGDHAVILATRYQDLQHGQDPSADIRLAPYDVVYVPKSGIAEVYKWYNQYIQQFANPNFAESDHNRDQCDHQSIMTCQRRGALDVWVDGTCDVMALG